MRRPARSPSALLTLPPQNDDPGPTNRPSTRGNLINEPTLYFSPYARKAMTSRPIKKTSATRSADKFLEFPPSVKGGGTLEDLEISSVRDAMGGNIANGAVEDPVHDRGLSPTDLLRDSNSGTGNNARPEFTVKESAIYYIAVTNALGTYTLSMAEQ